IRRAAVRLTPPGPESGGSPPAPPAAGGVGDFRPVREVGRGGVGGGYEAGQLSPKRGGGLEGVAPAGAPGSRQLQRFRHEAQAAGYLHHTNIVPVFAVGCERGVHFYAMQFIDGQSLATLIEDLRQRAGLGGPALDACPHGRTDATTTLLSEPE